MGDGTTDVNMEIADEDDELAAAIRMSMAQSSEPAGAPATASSAPLASPTPQDLVKEKFEEYKRQGMNPNDAALKAMAEVKAQTAAVAQKRPTSNEHKNLVKRLF